MFNRDSVLTLDTLRLQFADDEIRFIFEQRLLVDTGERIGPRENRRECYKVADDRAYMVLETLKSHGIRAASAFYTVIG